MSNVLVSVNNNELKEKVGSILQDSKFNITYTANSESLLNSLKEDQIYTTIIEHPKLKSNNQNLIQQIKKLSPKTEVIVLSSQKDERLMEEKFNNLIFEQLDDDFINNELEKHIQLSINKQTWEKGNSNGAMNEKRTIEKNVEIVKKRKKFQYDDNTSPQLVGESDAVQQLRESIEEVKPTNMNVMIRGESGTGKEVVASMLNKCEKGEWSDYNVKINCPSIPSSLLESELFGHEAGAFTGANKSKLGLLELANNGTVFLDEIGDISVEIENHQNQHQNHLSHQRQFGRNDYQKRVSGRFVLPIE